MLWLLLLLANSSQNQNPRNVVAPPPDMSLDLSQIDATADAVLAHIRAKGRFVRLSKRNEREVELSPVLAVQQGYKLPDEWTGGEDCTYQVMVRVGIPGPALGPLNVVAAPIQFVWGRDWPSRYSPRGLAVGAAVVALFVAMCSGISLLASLDSFDGDVLGGAGLIAGMSTVGLSIVVVAAVATPGGADWGGPFYRKPWRFVPVVALCLVPVMLSAGVGYSISLAHAQAWAGRMAGLDIDALDQRNGFRGRDPYTAEVMPAEGRYGDFDAWAVHENVHPEGLPKYRDGDHGLMVEWTEHRIAIDLSSTRFYTKWRAESREDVKWVAFVVRGTIPDMFEWANGRTSDVGWVNIRVVDVASSALISHATAIGGPNSNRVKSPARVYDVSTQKVIDLIADSVRSSYE